MYKKAISSPSISLSISNPKGLQERRISYTTTSASLHTLGNPVFSREMRTRRGLCYPKASDLCVEDGSDRLRKRRKVEVAAGDRIDCRKNSPEIGVDFAGGRDLFDSLPDDLVLCVLSKLSSTARCPADFVNVLITYGYLFIYYFSSCVQNLETSSEFSILNALLAKDFFISM